MYEVRTMHSFQFARDEIEIHAGRRDDRGFAQALPAEFATGEPKDPFGAYETEPAPWLTLPREFAEALLIELARALKGVEVGDALGRLQALERERNTWRDRCDRLIEGIGKSGLST
jgi:hypothetical protein